MGERSIIQLGVIIVTATAKAYEPSAYELADQTKTVVTLFLFCLISGRDDRNTDFIFMITKYIVQNSYLLQLQI